MEKYRITEHDSNTPDFLSYSQRVNDLTLQTSKHRDLSPEAMDALGRSH